MNYYSCIKTGRKKIAGIGSALIDILAHESEDTLLKIGGSKGGMTLVDSDFIENALSVIKNKYSVNHGGAACNAINGLGKLGCQTSFIAKCGNDRMGVFFEESLKKSGVEPVFVKSATPTGKVLSLITPDAQRTMFTNLGASAELSPDDIHESCFDDCAIVFIEGYLLFNRDLIFKALKTAKKSGAVIVLDLSSYTVVEASRDVLKDIIFKYVDIIMANEEEAASYSETSDEGKALTILSENVDIAVLKLGKRGSNISYKGKTVHIEGCGDGSALDTTGAGDLWASGFMYGLINGLSIEKSGKIASLCGYEVCQVDGASISDEGWNRIKSNI